MMTVPNDVNPIGECSVSGFPVGVFLGLALDELLHPTLLIAVHLPRGRGEFLFEQRLVLQKL